MDEIIVSAQALRDLARRGIPPEAVRVAFADPIFAVEQGGASRLCGAVGGFKLWIACQREGERVVVQGVRAERFK